MSDKSTTPEQIIQAFDDALDYIFGRSRGRDYAAKDDIAYAKSWIEDGLTVNVACFVFYHRMQQMHEYWLRQLNHTDNKNIPATLKFFDENIRSGIRRFHAGGEPTATWEQSESQWRARLIGFFSKGLWNKDMWGESPGHLECRAPQRLIDEVVSEREKKTALNNKSSFKK